MEEKMSNAVEQFVTLAQRAYTYLLEHTERRFCQACETWTVHVIARDVEWTRFCCTKCEHVHSQRVAE